MWWDQGILCSCAYCHMFFATEWLLVWDDTMLNCVLLGIMQLYWNFVGRKGKPVSKICGNSNQGKSLPLPGSEGYNVLNLSSIGCLVSLMDGLSGIVPSLTLNILCLGSLFSLGQTEVVVHPTWYFISSSVSVFVSGQFGIGQQW